MPWLSLDNATTLLDHDLNKARQALERGISKSWVMRQSGVPQPTTDPSAAAYPSNAVARLAP